MNGVVYGRFFVIFRLQLVCLISRPVQRIRACDEVLGKCECVPRLQLHNSQKTLANVADQRQSGRGLDKSTWQLVCQAHN